MYYTFLFKNNIISTFFDFIMLRFKEVSSPALEKRRSDGTNVAGIDRYIFACWLREDMWVCCHGFNCHHFKGSSFLDKFGSEWFVQV